MASFLYTYAAAKQMSGDIDLNTHDIRMLLVMTNTTADTEEDAQFISGVNGFTTLDEYDGANYVRKALANEAVVADEANNRGEFSADPVVWAALGVGTRQCQAVILYRHVNDDSDSIPIAFIDSGGFPFDGNGGDVTLTPNAEGLLQLANP